MTAARCGISSSTQQAPHKQGGRRVASHGGGDAGRCSAAAEMELAIWSSGRGRPWLLGELGMEKLLAAVGRTEGRTAGEMVVRGARSHGRRRRRELGTAAQGREAVHGREKGAEHMGSRRHGCGCWPSREEYGALGRGRRKGCLHLPARWRGKLGDEAGARSRTEDGAMGERAQGAAARRRPWS